MEERLIVLFALSITCIIYKYNGYNIIYVTKKALLNAISIFMLYYYNIIYVIYNFSNKCIIYTNRKMY